MSTPPEVRPDRAETSSSVAKPAWWRNPETLKTVALFTGVPFGGLVAGFLTAVLVWEASLRSFPAPVYTQVRLVEPAHLHDLATILLAAALLAAATVVVTIARPGRTRWLAPTALGLLLATGPACVTAGRSLISYAPPPPCSPSSPLRQRRSRGDHRHGGRRGALSAANLRSDPITGGRR